MGSKTDGFKSDHLKSNCCQEPIRFNPTSDGYSMEAWCPKCGNYVFTGRTEALISLWMGKMEAVISNKGYVPLWVGEKT